MFTNIENLKQRSETICTAKTISVESMQYFSYPITFVWPWNLDSEAKRYKKTKDNRDKIHGTQI